MEGELNDDDIVRNSAPNERDTARHPLTIADAVELFATFEVPRSKRSVQRFCEQGHLDCVRIKGPRGDQFFINRESVERYAEELCQIEAVATLGDEVRHDAPQRAVARNSAPERDMLAAAISGPVTPSVTIDIDEIERLRDENLNLRIDNRAKEIAIAELNRRMTEDRDKYLGAMQDMSYKLGGAESRLAQLEAPKNVDTPRQSAPGRDTEETQAVAAVPVVDVEPVSPNSESPIPKPQRSFFGRLLR